MCLVVYWPMILQSNYKASGWNRIVWRHERKRISNNDIKFITDQFVVIHLHKNWEDARQHCITLGGDLASIGNKEEFDLVNNLMATYKSDWRFFIGLNDRKNENKYVWSDGSQSIAAELGSVNAGGGRNENCMTIYGPPISVRDFFCNIALYFICKLKWVVRCTARFK